MASWSAKDLPSKRFKKHTLDSDEEEEEEDVEKLEYDDVEGQEEGNIDHEGEIKITPFNMKDEMEDGYFDKEGTYHWSQNKEIRDNWLDSVDSIKIIERKQVEQEDSNSDSDEEFDNLPTYREMLTLMKEGETVAKAIRRLGHAPKHNQRKRKREEDQSKAADRAAMLRLTELANTLLQKEGNMDIYQETWHQINFKVNPSQLKPDGDSLDMFAEDVKADDSKTENGTPIEESNEVKWEVKKNEDSEIEGPYENDKMMEMAKSDTDCLVRRKGGDGAFYSIKRIDFELYT